MDYQDMQITDSVQRKEKARKKIVKLVFIIYFLYIIEGAIRKWLFFGLNKPLIFMKDPFVLLVYFTALQNNMWPKKGLGLPTWLAIITLAILPVHLMEGRMPFLGLLVGWRSYFFYIPLAFIIGEQFRGEDLKRLIKWTLYLALPIAAICFKQYTSPLDSFINRTPEAGVIFTESGTSGGEIIRTIGTFTFFHGQQVFAGALFVFILTTWILPKEERFFKVKFLCLVSGAVGLIYALDLTRLPTFLAAFILIASLGASFLLKNQKMRSRMLLIPVVLVFFVSVFFIAKFSDVSEKRTERLQASDTQPRIKAAFTRFLKVYSRVPLFGYGTGFNSGRMQAAFRGSDADINKEELPPPVFPGEEEWPRMIADIGPLLGLAYVLFRILLTKRIIKESIAATKQSGNPLPILLAACLAPILLLWYITQIQSVMNFAWLFAGFCMAANQLGKATAGNAEDIFWS